MYPAKIDGGNSTLNFRLDGNEGERSRERCMAEPGKYNYTVDVFHAYAMEWLEKSAHGQKPFFLYLSYTIPHAGDWGDVGNPQGRKLRGRHTEKGNPIPYSLYADRDWPDVERDHASAVTYMDSKVGDLMARVHTLGIDEDTVVFFASDNGAHNEGHHDVDFFDSSGGLRGWKRSLYEGGVRSPTMVRWPGTIAPNRESNYAWAFWDALPTLADLAGATPPKGLDGHSVVPTLMGEYQQPPEYIYFTWPGCGGGPSGYSLRAGDWKVVAPHCGDTLQPSLDDVVQLYNLESDPFEQNDVAEFRPWEALRLLRIATAKNLSCRCYQCHFRGKGIDECTKPRRLSVVEGMLV